MTKKCLTIVFIIATILLGACAYRASDSEQASQALNNFFDELSEGRYDAAARSYGGSYEVLFEYNPDVDPDDHAALWQRGCQVNGFMCLPVRTATFNELTAGGEYIFTVEFENPDGSPFVRVACCGENPESPPQSQFEYRVVKGGDGLFRVLDLPVYVP